MIDGVKIMFRSATIVEDLKALGAEVNFTADNDTAELKYRQAEYRSLRFMIRKANVVLIDGSLHKYWKDENHSLFTYGDLCECINDLAQKFNVSPSVMRLQNLEFGVNIRPPFNPFDFCDAVLTHKDESFSKFQSKGVHIGFEGERRQYSVKIYDKGKQYEKNENILRFEIRANKMVFIKRTRITNLSDLTDVVCLDILGKKLCETYNELIILDEVDKRNLTTKERQIYNQCQNPKEWVRFTRKQRTTRKRQFNNIIQQHGKWQWQTIVGKMIATQWQMLLAMNKKQGTF